MKQEIDNKIQEIVYGRGVWGSPARCWWLCLNVAKKMPKKMRDNLFLAESETHYWLQDIEGNNYDIYGDFEGFDYDLIPTKLYSVNEVLNNPDTTFDEREVYQTATGKEGFKRVYYFKSSSLKNYLKN